MINVEAQNVEIAEAWDELHKNQSRSDLILLFGSEEQLEMSMSLFALAYKKGYMSVLNKVRKVLEE